MNHEQNARANHENGFNCAQAVTVAWADALGLSPIQAMQSAPRPRGEGGKCGAYLAACQLLSQLKPDALETFRQRFLEANGSLECGKLRRSGIPCNDLVGCAARLVEELVK